jgi:hypothetical protein
VREAIAALESALSELEHARNELPEDLRVELATIVENARALLASLRERSSD